MARKPRIVIDGGFYHLVQRGNNRKRVFREDGDFTCFYYLLRKYLNRHPAHVYHYCLMSNHLHLLLKIIKAKDLSMLMQGINLSYTLHYKRKYKFTGSLWQGRFKSIDIKNDGHLIECGRYIERNPVRAGIVKDPKDYLHSSYNHYAFGKKSDIITEDILYNKLGSTEKERQAKYREYALEERPYESIIDKALKI